MKIICKNSYLLLVVCLVLAGCIPHSRHSILTNPDADIRSSVEEISKHNNDNANIVRKLPKKIGNMELYNVVDYTKRIIVGPDLGYGIFYDLKNNKKGSGNIFIYKRYNQHVDSGLSDGALTELKVERRDIEHKDATNAPFSIVNYGDFKFYKMKFVTPPDRKNNQYDCYLFISGCNNIYLKTLFYYSMNSDYGEKETDIFMNSLVTLLNATTK